MRAKEERKTEDGLGLTHAIWLLWFAVLIIGGPLVWVTVYSFVNPPMTLAMAVNSDQPLDRIWTPLAKISPNLIDAAIAAEDVRFCSHHGFDHQAIGESWRGNRPGKPLDRSETISAQTAKIAFLWPNRTWLRQALDAYFTLLMETIWSKKRIMEVYLNIAEWGDGVYGAPAAARYYFDTDVSRLTGAQAARLVAILPQPRQWSPLSDAPLIYYRARMIQERGDLVRVDGKDTCVVPHT